MTTSDLPVHPAADDLTVMANKIKSAHGAVGSTLQVRTEGRSDQSWRAIENQIVRFFQSQGCVVTQDSGDFFLCVLDGAWEEEDDVDCGFEVSLTDLARELAAAIDGARP
jgi:hypothetical protein